MLYWPSLQPKRIVQAFDLLRGRRDAAEAGRRKPQTMAAAPAPSKPAAAKPVKGR